MERKRKIYLYAGYYETFISDKDLSKYGYMLQGEFDSVVDAENFRDENFDEDWRWIDRDLLDESGYALDPLSDDWYMYTFEVTEEGIHTDEVPED